MKKKDSPAEQATSSRRKFLGGAAAGTATTVPRTEAGAQS